MWLGQTDAAIVSLELAQRIDPVLNAVDRFALSTAYFLKGRYSEAIQQAEINLRNSASSTFSYIVLAAAHAQLGHVDDAARVASSIRRVDPTFDPSEFGSKFRSLEDRESLRKALHKAGLVIEAATQVPARK